MIRYDYIEVTVGPWSTFFNPGPMKIRPEQIIAWQADNSNSAKEAGINAMIYLGDRTCVHIKETVEELEALMFPPMSEADKAMYKRFGIDLDNLQDDYRGADHE